MSNQSTSKHKLVVLGDSVSQGFQNGGVYRTDLNFPSFLAQCFEAENQFDQPLFTAQAGIPLNLEVLVRGLGEEYGDTLQWNELLPAVHHLYSTLKRVKKYWEGGFKSLETDHPTPYHNQSVWGFAMNDAWLVTEEACRDFIENQPETYSIFDVLPDHAMYITARMVLNPTFGEQHAQHTMLDNIKLLQNDGGIENLIVTMGHNNIIGAVTDLKFQYTEKDDLNKFPSERGYTVYRPEHFEQEYRALAERVSKIGAERVISQTLPYVTIPPVSRGINEDSSRHEGGYFDYYTRFWIWDSDFDPDKHSHLTKQQAIKLDQAVDEYNKIIRDVSREYGWITVPLNKYVSAIARRRLAGDLKIPYPKDFTRAMQNNEATAHLVGNNGQPKLSTDYLRIDEDSGKVFKGGIFSLDGIHPTTIGYGLIAHVYYETMEKHGVDFQKPLDWDHIIASDTLITDPPYLLVELKSLLRFLSMERQKKLSFLGNGVLDQLMKLISPRREG
ncbi:MAG: hypothetical protein U5J95_07865 [Balneolaceae bacterium]|nr:hypothetical protein [Balneolaceae bacterium]